MTERYRPGHRARQPQFDTERLADRIEARLLRAALTDEDQAFITRLDVCFLATADADGFPNGSYKGGDPGFARVLDAGTIACPVFDGNGMSLSPGNASENPAVGLRFVDFENQKRLRLNGSAALAAADSAAPPYPAAQFLVRVAVRQVFPDCPRTVHKMQRVESSRDVPQPGVQTPVCG